MKTQHYQPKPRESLEPCSKLQIQKIEMMITATNSNINDILSYYNKASLKEFTKQMASNCINLLIKKYKK